MLAYSILPIYRYHVYQHSFLMVVFIAPNRYLHMSYLERYPFIVTKKRPYSLKLLSILLLLITNAMFALPVPNNVKQIFQTIYLLFATPTIFAIPMLCYCTMKTIRKKAIQVTSDVINQTRALSNASKLIAISATCLLMPLLTINAIKLVNRHYRLCSSSILNEIKMFSYVIYSFNALWSNFFHVFKPPNLIIAQEVCKKFC